MKNIVVWKPYEKNWEKKTSWKTIWNYFEKDWKEYIKIDLIPTWRDWFASIFEKKEEDKSDVPF